MSYFGKKNVSTLKVYRFFCLFKCCSIMLAYSAFLLPFISHLEITKITKYTTYTTYEYM